MVNEFRIHEVARRLRGRTDDVRFWKEYIGAWNRMFFHGQTTDSKYRERLSACFTQLNKSRADLRRAIRRMELVLSLRKMTKARIRLI